MLRDGRSCIIEKNNDLFSFINFEKNEEISIEILFVPFNLSGFKKSEILLFKKFEIEPCSLDIGIWKKICIKSGV